MNNIFNNKEKDFFFKNLYKEWKLDAFDDAGYFVIFQGFVETNILNNISGNALKLFIYLGVYSDNMTGVVWHSNTKIASYFNKSERTIRTWMKELEDLNLIKRMRLKYDGAVYSYLQPYTFRKLPIKFEDPDQKEKKKEKKKANAFVIFDQNGFVYLKYKNNYIPIDRVKSIEIMKDGKWIEGQIDIQKTVYNWSSDNIKKFKYIFISDDKKYIFELDENIIEVIANKVD